MDPMTGPNYVEAVRVCVTIITAPQAHGCQHSQSAQDDDVDRRLYAQDGIRLKDKGMK